MITLIKIDKSGEWSKCIDEKYIRSIMAYDSSEVRVCLKDGNPYNVESINCNKIKHE